MQRSREHLVELIDEAETPTPMSSGCSRWASRSRKPRRTSEPPASIPRIFRGARSPCGRTRSRTRSSSALGMYLRRRAALRGRSSSSSCTATTSAPTKRKPRPEEGHQTKTGRAQAAGYRAGAQTLLSFGRTPRAGKRASRPFAHVENYGTYGSPCTARPLADPDGARVSSQRARPGSARMIFCIYERGRQGVVVRPLPRLLKTRYGGKV
jgi:hypothetical protein